MAHPRGQGKRGRAGVSRSTVPGQTKAAALGVPPRRLGNRLPSLDASLQNAEDAQYHVGDDEHDDNDGGVLDEGGGHDPSAARAARRRLPRLVLELVDASSSTTHAPPYPKAWLPPPLSLSESPGSTEDAGE